MKLIYARKNNKLTYRVEYTDAELKRMKEWALYVQAFSTAPSENYRTSSNILLMLRNAAIIKDEEIPGKLKGLLEDISWWRSRIQKVYDARADLTPEEKKKASRAELALKIQKEITNKPEIRDALFNLIYNTTDRLTKNTNYLRIPQSFFGKEDGDITAYVVQNFMNLDKTKALRDFDAPDEDEEADLEDVDVDADIEDGKKAPNVGTSIVDWLVDFDNTKPFGPYIEVGLRQKAKNAIKVLTKMGKDKKNSLETKDDSGKTKEIQVQDKKAEQEFINAESSYTSLLAWSEEVYTNIVQHIKNLVKQNPKNEVYLQKGDEFRTAYEAVYKKAKLIDNLQFAYSENPSSASLKKIQEEAQAFIAAFTSAMRVFPYMNNLYKDDLIEILETRGLLPSTKAIEEQKSMLGEQNLDENAVEETSGDTSVNSVDNNAQPQNDKLQWLKENAPALARNLLEVGGKPGDGKDERNKSMPAQKIFGKPDASGKPKMRYYLPLTKLLHLGIDSIKDFDDLIDETKSLSSQNYEAIMSQLIAIAAFYESKNRSVEQQNVARNRDYTPQFGRYLYALIKNFVNKYGEMAQQALVGSGEAEANDDAMQQIEMAKAELTEKLKAIARRRFGGRTSELSDEQVINMTTANNVLKPLLYSIDPAMRLAAYHMFMKELQEKANKKLEFGGRFGGEALTDEEIVEIAQKVFEKIYLSGEADMTVKDEKGEMKPAKGFNFLYPKIMEKELRKLNDPATKGEEWIANISDFSDGSKKSEAQTTRYKLKRFASKEELSDLASYYDNNNLYEFADKVDRLIMKWYANA